MDPLVLIGPAYSVYVRIVRMVLIEKSIPFETREFDIFDPAAHPVDYRQRHPFSKVPLLCDAGFDLFETSAIVRYLDQKYPAPGFTPKDIGQQAVMNQVISVVDNYAYPAMVWGLYVEQVDKPSEGIEPDPKTVTRALQTSENCLGWLSKTLGNDGYFGGDSITLGDFYLSSIFLYFEHTELGRLSLGGETPLAQWWQRVRDRDSVAEFRELD